VTDSENNPLPQGWVQTSLGAITEPRTGKADPQASPRAKFIGMEHVEAHTMRLLGTVPAGSMKSGANTFQPFDVLYGRMRSYLNKVYQPDFAGLCSGEFIVFPESPAVRGRFLKYRLNAADFVRFANHINTGDRPRVDFDQIKTFGVDLPPRAEQERIADALDELFTNLDEGVAALERVRAHLGRYKIAILMAAVSGSLSAKIRAVRPAVEPAAVMLARITAERRAIWEGAQSERVNATERSSRSSARIKYKEAVARVSGDLPPLPEGWCWATVDQSGEVRLGRQRAPQHHTGKHMRPYLRVANVYEDRLDLTDVKEMNFNPTEFETYALRNGDVLLNEGQSPELVGRPAIYRSEIAGCCYQKTLLRFRPHAGILPEWALIVFRSYLHSGRFRRSANITTSIGHLAAERFRPIEFPIPPTSEQVIIAETVEQQLSVVDHLEADIITKQASARALRESILSRAFTGQLVSQDRDDEPAAELLRQIATIRSELTGQINIAKHTRHTAKKSHNQIAKRT
jgi:type I restriction enzyme S subunit